MTDIVPVSEIEDLMLAPFRKYHDSALEEGESTAFLKAQVNIMAAGLEEVVKVMSEAGIVFARRGDEPYEYEVSKRYQVQEEHRPGANRRTILRG